MRHASKIGITNQYRNNELSRSIIRRYMALPLLPWEHIQGLLHIIIYYIYLEESLYLFVN